MSSRNLGIFMIPSISWFKIINIFRFAKSEGSIPNPKTSFRIAASVDDSAAVNPNGIKTLLGNGLSTFSLKAIQFAVMVQQVYLEILLTISSQTVSSKFLKILYQLVNICKSIGLFQSQDRFPVTLIGCITFR